MTKFSTLMGALLFWCSVAAFATAQIACSGGGTSQSQGDAVGIDGAIDADGAIGDVPEPEDVPLDSIADGVDIEVGVDATADAEVDVAIDATDDGAPDLPDLPIECRNDQCEIDGACFDNGAVHSESNCQRCLVLVADDAWSADDGGECTDGDPCSTNACLGGECVVLEVACDDGNPCTTDGCADGDCQNTATDGPCEDGDPCTINDECTGGTCVPGAPKTTCNDDDPCTMGACVPGVGCVGAATDLTPCDDGDACTTGDHCLGGLCNAGLPKFCGDFDTCTTDWCDPDAGCQHTDLASFCTDENPCTDEACDPVKGCIYPLNTHTCDDGNACTGGDRCAAGKCKGTNLTTDDGNLCTDDGCHPDTGVFNTLVIGRPCSDGTVCTVGDACDATGACVSGLLLGCDDENPCTDDSCDIASGCVNLPNTIACDDGEPCTDDDECAEGSCGGTPLSCDDGDPCTDDGCVSGEGCVSNPIPSGGCRPQIIVTSPARAKTVLGADADDRTVVVQGTVETGTAELLSFTVNGANVTVGAEGEFSAPVQARFGMNKLVLEAEDALGQSARVVRSFTWSTGYLDPVEGDPWTNGTPGGLAALFSQNALDDGDHSTPPDDLATIAEIVFRGLDPGGMSPSPVKIGDDLYELRISHLDFDVEGFNIESTDAGLAFTAGLSDITFDLDIVGLCFVCPSLTGSGTVPSIDFTGGATMGTELKDEADPDAGKRFSVVINETTVELGALDIDLDGAVLDFLLGEILTLAAAGFTDRLENSLAGTFSDILTGVLSGAMNAFALSIDFSVPPFFPGQSPIGIFIRTRPEELVHSDEGLAIHFQAGASNFNNIVTYPSLGAAMRAPCNAGDPIPPVLTPILAESELELSLRDDLLNQVFHSLWQGGLLEFDLPDSMWAGADLEGLGVTDLGIHVTGLGAPVIDSCDGWRLGIGDLKFEIDLTVFGKPGSLSVYVSLDAGITMVEADGQLEFGVSEITAIDTEVDIHDDHLLAVEAQILPLVDDILVPQLIAALSSESLATFPLPSLNFGGLSSTLPSNIELVLVADEIIQNDGAYVKAHLEPDALCTADENCPTARYCVAGACVACTTSANCAVEASAEDPEPIQKFCDVDTSFFGLTQCREKRPTGPEWSCTDDDQCQSDRCSPILTCAECDTHSDCVGGYCLAFSCYPGLADNTPCTEDFLCLSGSCGPFPTEFCYTPDSGIPGDPCKVAASCQSGECLLDGSCGCGGDDDACNSNQYCNLVGKCRPSGEIGAPCTFNNECDAGNCWLGSCEECNAHADCIPSGCVAPGCVATEYCNLPVLPTAASVCTAKQADGYTTCGSDIECLSGICTLGKCVECIGSPQEGCAFDTEYCSGNTCHAKGGIGDTCGSSGQCDSGICEFGKCIQCTNVPKTGCDFDNQFCEATVCVDIGDIGADCGGAAQCLSGICEFGKCIQCTNVPKTGCDFDTQFCEDTECVNLGGIGASCGGPAQCASGICEFGKCIQCTNAPKTGCDFDTQYCEATVCDDKGGIGDDCGGPNQCISGRCPWGVCVACTINNDCSGSNWCNSSYKCKSPMGTGSTCSGSAQCSSDCCILKVVGANVCGAAGLGKVCL